MRYDLRLDVANTAPACDQSFVIEAGHHSQTLDRAEVTYMRVQASFDEGATWWTADVTPADDDATGRFQRFAVGVNPSLETGLVGDRCAPPDAYDTGYVALRVYAQDANGGTITQTMPRAYMLR